MQNSVAQLYAVPDAAVSNQPAPIAKARKGTPTRVVVRNVGATLLFLSFASTEVSQGGANSAAYELPPGQSEVVVLAPEQTLFAMSLGLGGRVTTLVSDAFPIM